MSIGERRLVGLVMAVGDTNREIAEALDMVEQTVKNMLSGVYRKCDVRNRPELVRLAFQAGLFRWHSRIRAEGNGPRSLDPRHRERSSHRSQPGAAGSSH